MANSAYISNLIQRINAITTCAELAEVSQESLQYFAGLEASVASQVSLYASLIIAPTDLPSLITWANKVISTFAGPYASAVALEAELVVLQASVLAAISSKLGTLACERIIQADLNSMMRIPAFGVSINGLSVFGGG